MKTKAAIEAIGRRLGQAQRDFPIVLPGISAALTWWAVLRWDWAWAALLVAAFGGFIAHRAYRFFTDGMRAP